YLAATMEPLAQYPANYEFRTAIMWFRRDLRVDDNPALVAALNASANVIPVFVWAPEEEGQFQPGRCSRWWTKHSLVDLQQALAALGSRLIIRRSTDSTAALLKVVAEVGAEAVFFNHLYDPISLMRDHDCKRGLTAAGVSHRTFNGDMLYEPWEILDSNKQPYSTFDDFWNSVRAMPVPPPFPVAAPAVMPPVLASVPSLTVTEVDWFFTAEQEASSDQLKFKWKPGVGGAIAELERFAMERLHAFEHDRAKVDRDSTSRLSPWVHIGSISVRYIFYRIRQCQAEWLAIGVDRTRSCDDFLQQVGYREYSRYLSFHFPFIHERSLLRHLRACPWRIDQQAFKAWRQGQTGYPLVDAAMRQLWSSGWCHNRARVVAASFLVKDLLLPWQWGLKHYWDAQIDADLECDALGWQYVSGGMSDAHPFSYMMDLEKEARRFDPDGEYVRRWLPVLSRLPTEHIHAPWKASPQVLAAADVELGCNYPLPIISRNDAHANVKYACAVLDKCVVAQSSESSGRYPYRAPTFPAAVAGAGASSGANPTGARGGGAGGAATQDGSAPHSQQNQNVYISGSIETPQELQQTGGGGGEGGEGVWTSGGGSGAVNDGGYPRKDLRSGSATGGVGSGPGAPASAPVSQGVAAPMGPPPAKAAVQQAPPPAAPGGGVYYHPGDAAGQQLLERILQQQQQRRTRVNAARQPDGSGTDRPPPNYRSQLPQNQQQQQQQQHAGQGLAPGTAPAAGSDRPEAAAAAAALAAAAWAGRMDAGDADDEAVALWQHQQMLQGGTAAYAFEQAMQMLLARRRMVDGVSNISGDGGDGPDSLALDDTNSEEVVSNTVNLNVTAFTGASCHRNQMGTARGARKRGRMASAAAAAAARGDKRGAMDEADDAEGAGEPAGYSPLRSEGDEADPVHGRQDPESKGRAIRRRPGNCGGGVGGSESPEGDDDDDDTDMACSGEGEADVDVGGSPQREQAEEREDEEDEVDMEGRTPQGGVANMAEDGTGSPSSEGNGYTPDTDDPPQLHQSSQQLLHQYQHQTPCRQLAFEDGQPRKCDKMEEDRIDGSAPRSSSPSPSRLAHRQQHQHCHRHQNHRSSLPQREWPGLGQQHGGAFVTHGAGASGDVPSGVILPRNGDICSSREDPDAEMACAMPASTLPGAVEGLGLHKRRRSGSAGSVDCD
ncbi:hypothetical protein VaNZ11_004772, partial [Volvox africanus]